MNREVIKATAADSVTFRPVGLFPNTVPIALVTPRGSMANLIRSGGAASVRLSARKGILLEDVFTSSGEIRKFEMHRNMSTANTPSKTKRTISRSSPTELELLPPGKT